MWKLFNVLPAVATRSSQLFSRQFSDDIYFFDLPASVFNHFCYSCLFCAHTADCFLYIAPSIIFPVSSKDATTNCEVRIGAVSSWSRLECKLMKFLHFLLVKLLFHILKLYWWPCGDRLSIINCLNDCFILELWIRYKQSINTIFINLKKYLINRILERSPYAHQKSVKQSWWLDDSFLLWIIGKFCSKQIYATFSNILKIL